MVVNTQATPGDGRWWSGRKSDQGLAGCVSGPVHNQDHTMKHTGPVRVEVGERIHDQ